MRIVSVNVGLPRVVEWKGRLVTTSIFKKPVAGRVRLRKLNLDGDRQADPAVHGGADKAIYAYPTEHYAYWRRELAGKDLPWGMFGENLSTEGLLEEETNVGDRFRIGSAEVVVTQPRLPCYKLGLRFERDDMVRRFLASGRTGFYLQVAQEGEVAAGDRIELIERDGNQLSVATLTRLYKRDDLRTETVERALQVEALPEGWRQHFRKQLESG